MEIKKRKFKPGDKVRIYTNPEFCPTGKNFVTGVVDGYCLDACWVVVSKTNSPWHNYGERVMWHEKQCEKIKDDA